MSKYNIVHKGTNSYGISKIGPRCHRIVKNLKDYEDEKEAIDDLTKLLNGEIKEHDLTGSRFEQGVETGKHGNRVLILEATLKNICNRLIQAIGDTDKLDKAAREALKQIYEVLDLGRKER